MEQATSSTFPRTIGMDLGVRSSAYSAVSPTGERIQEGSVRSTRPEMKAFLEGQPRSRIVMEASGSSHWVAELAESSGHEVVVANPREFRLICESHRKSDRNDARILADFGQFRPQLLKPLKLRGSKCQIARATLAARAHVVKQRTQIINLVRAEVRCMGESIDCTAAAFRRRAPHQVPAPLRSALGPILELLEAIEKAIAAYDAEIARLCEVDFPETARLTQVDSVGPNTALAFVATIEDPSRFQRSRAVGAYVGLAAKSRASGSYDPELRISKRGDKGLRRLLVTAATRIVGPRGVDCDLKRFGERLAERGGQAARAKARIAVARKLAILLHRLLVTGEVWEPLRNHPQEAAA